MVVVVVVVVVVVMGVKRPLRGAAAVREPPPPTHTHNGVIFTVLLVWARGRRKGTGGMAQLLRTPMGDTEVGQIWIGGRSPHPKTNMGVGVGGLPPPMVPRFVKNGQKWPKLVQNRHCENRIWATFSWGGGGPLPPTPKGQKKAQSGPFSAR